MKNGKRMLAAMLAAVCAGAGWVPASAASPANLSDHADTVSVGMYETVKILSGFLPGESLQEASSRFACGEQMVFLDADGAVLDRQSGVYTGAVVCVTEGEQVTDLGILTVFGDTDGNGAVNSADARRILRYAAGLEKTTALTQAAADMNGNGKADSADARTALRAAAKLEEIVNPIGRKPADSEIAAIYAYYTGEAPQAGSVLNRSAIQVIAVTHDAKYTVVDSGYTVEPASLTSEKPGKVTFTVTWNGFSSEFTVSFTERIPEQCYPDSDVPDFGAFSGIAPSQILHEIGYVTYRYSAARNVTDLVLFESYMKYLESCGFVCTDKKADSACIAALFEKKGSQNSAAVVYDFSGKRIVVAVQ